MRDFWSFSLILCLVSGLVFPVATSAQCCEGDLDGDDAVGINELIRAVPSALDGCPDAVAGVSGTEPCKSDCPGDHDEDGEVTIAELIRAVNRALTGCPVRTIGPPPTSTPTGATATPTESPDSTANITDTPTNTPTDTATVTGTPTGTPTATASDTPSPTPTDTVTPGGDRFVDNGDGTISDTQTGLMWEKKSWDGTIHEHFDFYRWSAEFGSETPDGSVFTEFLLRLNTDAAECKASGDPHPCCLAAGEGTCVTFAGHSDWRLPTLAELLELRELGEDALSGVIPLPFFSGCTQGCGVLTCDCTTGQKFWTSTMGPPLIAGDTSLPQVQTVDFNVSAPSNTALLLTNASAAVRAVRGP